MCSGSRAAPLGPPPAHLLDGTERRTGAVDNAAGAGLRGGDVARHSTAQHSTARPGGAPSAAHRELRLLREPRCSPPAPLMERAELCGMVKERGPAWCVAMSGSAGMGEEEKAGDGSLQLSKSGIDDLKAKAQRPRCQNDRSFQARAPTHCSACMNIERSISKWQNTAFTLKKKQQVLSPALLVLRAVSTPSWQRWFPRAVQPLSPAVWAAVPQQDVCVCMVCTQGPSGRGGEAWGCKGMVKREMMMAWSQD